MRLIIKLMDRNLAVSFLRETASQKIRGADRSKSGLDLGNDNESLSIAGRPIH